VPPSPDAPPVSGSPYGLSAAHSGEGHLCVPIADAYSQRHGRLSDCVYTQLVPLKDQLVRKVQQVEEKLIVFHNARQRVDDETRASYEGIRQRLKSVAAPKSALLQSFIRDAKVLFPPSECPVYYRSFFLVFQCRMISRQLIASYGLSAFSRPSRAECIPPPQPPTRSHPTLSSAHTPHRSSPPQ
jgi:hypothetical protein